MLAIRPRALPTLLLTIAMVLAACGSAGPSQPSATPSPTPPAEPVDSPDEAARRVLEQNPQFGDLEPLDPDLIGQCCWYEATEVPGGYEVTIRFGWGDCMAGCIHQHTWTYAVAPDGAVALLSERGDPLEPGVLPGETGGVGVVDGEGPTALIVGTATSGPHCPVEREGDPACLPQPVAGAVIIIRGADGLEVGRVQANEGGLFTFALLPGRYTLEPQPVEGLLGTPGPIHLTVEDAREVAVEIDYDTGIR